MIKSRTTRSFRQALATLPALVREHALRAYRLFHTNPQHPSLQFKKLANTNSTYSVRIGLGYRALAVIEDDELIWFWIGSHEAYDRLV